MVARERSTASYPHKVYAGEDYAVLFQGGPLELYNSSCCKAKPLVLVEKEKVLELPLRSFSLEPLDNGYGLWSSDLEIVNHFFGGVISCVIEDLPVGTTSFDFDRTAYERAYRRSVFLPLGTAHHAFPEAVEELEQVTQREFNRMEAWQLVKECLGPELKVGKEDYRVYLNGQPLFMCMLQGKYRRRQLECSSYQSAVQPAVEVRFRELVSGVGYHLLRQLVPQLKQMYPNLYYDVDADDDLGKLAFSIIYEKKRVNKKSLQNLPRILEKIEREIAATKGKIRKAERELEKY
ncbi:MAG: hypothetical protein AABX13_01060 [Nanoarchaeota archaeon]